MREPNGSQPPRPPWDRHRRRGRNEAAGGPQHVLERFEGDVLRNERLRSRVVEQVVPHHVDTVKLRHDAPQPVPATSTGEYQKLEVAQWPAARPRTDDLPHSLAVGQQSGDIV